MSADDLRPIVSDHHEANARAQSEDERREAQQQLKRETSKALWEAELAAEVEYQRQAGLTWGTGVTGASFTGTVSIAQAVRPQQPQQPTLQPASQENANILTSPDWLTQCSCRRKHTGGR